MLSTVLLVISHYPVEVLFSLLRLLEVPVGASIE